MTDDDAECERIVTHAVEAPDDRRGDLQGLVTDELVLAVGVAGVAFVGGYLAAMANIVAATGVTWTDALLLRDAELVKVVALMGATGMLFIGLSLGKRATADDDGGDHGL